LPDLSGFSFFVIASPALMALSAGFAISENEILNPKSETLNKFKIQIPNVQNGLTPD
jgi:hypothetical protein